MNIELMLSFIGTICAIIGVIYLVYQFGILPKQENNEIKTNLLSLYRTNQRVIDDLISELDEYNGEIIFSGNLTFSGYIKYLQDMRDHELSEELFMKITDEKLSKENCNVMIDSLQKQKDSFNQSIMYLKTNFGRY